MLVIYNVRGIVTLILTFAGVYSGMYLGSRFFSYEWDNFPLALAISGLVMFFIDLMTRVKKGMYIKWWLNLLSPKSGGHIYYLPIWIIGILGMLLFPEGVKKIKNHSKSEIVKEVDNYSESEAMTQEEIDAKKEEVEVLRELDEEMKWMQVYDDFLNETNEDDKILVKYNKELCWYEGKIDKLRPSGKGKLIDRDGSIMYEGDFVEGHFEGNGDLVVVHGKYRGEIEHGEMNGTGTLKDIFGGTYSGEFKDNLFDGEGAYLQKDGSKYEGEWLAGVMHGKGKATYLSGDYYEGEWKNGVQDGKGKMTFVGQGVIEGTWVNGKENGKARVTLPDGSWQDVEYVDGVMQE